MIDEGEGCARSARKFLWCAFLFFHRLYIQGDCMYATCIDTCSTLIYINYIHIQVRGGGGGGSGPPGPPPPASALGFLQHSTLL